MGNACGTPASGRERVPERSALDALISEKVKDYTRRHPVEASKTVNQIAMKFPSMLSSFEALRGIFDRVDKDANGFIEKHEFVTAVEEGFSRKVTVEREMIERIYDEADLKHDGRVNYKEFVLMIVLLYLVSWETDLSVGKDTAVSGSAGEDTLVHNAVQKVLEAFLFFDANGDGYIRKDEVLKKLEAHEGAHAKQKTEHGGLTAARFRELDWDKSGRVDFKQFLFAVEGWCGMDDDLDGSVEGGNNAGGGAS